MVGRLAGLQFDLEHGREGLAAHLAPGPDPFDDCALPAMLFRDLGLL